MAEFASCQVLVFKPTYQPYLNEGLVDVLLLVLTVSLSSDLFNNTEVDGRIIEVRHDKMG